jgi:ribosomal protein S10
LDLTVISPTLRNAAKANKKAAENIICLWKTENKNKTMDRWNSATYKRYIRINALN